MNRLFPYHLPSFCWKQLPLTSSCTPTCKAISEFSDKVYVDYEHFYKGFIFLHIFHVKICCMKLALTTCVSRCSSSLSLHLVYLFLHLFASFRHFSNLCIVFRLSLKSITILYIFLPYTTEHDINFIFCTYLLHVNTSLYVMQ